MLLIFLIQLYWIFDIQKQKRVVAKDADDEYLSIPMNYELLFQKVRRKGEARES